MGGAQSLCQEEPQAYAIRGMSHQLGKTHCWPASWLAKDTLESGPRSPLEVKKEVLVPVTNSQEYLGRELHFSGPWFYNTSQHKEAGSHYLTTSVIIHLTLNAGICKTSLPVPFPE